MKDAFHEQVVKGSPGKVHPSQGTKAAFYYKLNLPAGGQEVLRLRLSSEDLPQAFGPDFDRIFEDRAKETKAYYDLKIPQGLSPGERAVADQAYAGLLWSKQYYLYQVAQWLEGDPNQPPPDENRKERPEPTTGTISGPRTSFPCPTIWNIPGSRHGTWPSTRSSSPASIPFSPSTQLILLLREWYMHPNGQIPAYEFAFSDVNPPLQAWAAWRVYKISAPRGQRDRVFLSRVFQKLLINFTWWVNRKDAQGNNLFSGGFLGLDNIGVFDRGQMKLGSLLEQADGTAWMAFYCGTLLSMALELSLENAATEDMATKFFEHYLSIVRAMNHLGGTGLWDETDGFYYDQFHYNGSQIPLKIRSAVGIIPLFAVEILKEETLDKLPEFYKRMKWFMQHKPEEAGAILRRDEGEAGKGCYLLAVPSKDRLLGCCDMFWTRRNSFPPTASGPFPNSTRTTPMTSTWTAKTTGSITNPPSHIVQLWRISYWRGRSDAAQFLFWWNR